MKKLQRCERAEPFASVLDSVVAAVRPKVNTKELDMLAEKLILAAGCTLPLKLSLISNGYTFSKHPVYLNQ